jgi:hypothetical protein
MSGCKASFLYYFKGLAGIVDSRFEIRNLRIKDQGHVPDINRIVDAVMSFS